MTKTNHEITINRRTYEVTITVQGNEVHTRIKYVKGRYTNVSSVHTIYIGCSREVRIIDRELPKSTIEKLTAAVTELVAEYLAN